MHFHPVAARPNWREQAEELGFIVSLLSDPPYWIEAIDQPFCCAFAAEEIEDVIATATRELADLAFEVVEEVCCGRSSEKRFDQLCIPVHFREAIRKSWHRRDCSLYGRFDFAYDGNSLKLLELNFDTPTSLYESAVIQKKWFEDSRRSGAIPDAAAQSNELEERLTRATKQIIPASEVFHLGTFEHAIEETENVKFIQSCAERAGLRTQFIFFDAIRLDNSGKLIDLNGEPITRLFKLFPWELVIDEDARHFAVAEKYIFAPLVEAGITSFLEPAWKCILSNKAVLPLFWELAPNHRYLLEARMDDQSAESEALKKLPHVRKPIFGREGLGVSVVVPDSPEESEAGQDDFGEIGYVVQALADLQKYLDYHIVVGSWLVAGEFAGINVRADRSKITGRSALFVPHYVSP